MKTEIQVGEILQVKKDHNSLETWKTHQASSKPNEPIVRKGTIGKVIYVYSDGTVFLSSINDILYVDKDTKEYILTKENIYIPLKKLSKTINRKKSKHFCVIHWYDNNHKISKTNISSECEILGFFNGYTKDEIGRDKKCVMAIVKELKTNIELIVEAEQLEFIKEKITFKNFLNKIKR